MPLLNFQSRFVPMIESGAKCHTIRGKRKLPIRVGDKLYLYTGLRRKGARKLIETLCTRVERIEIREVYLDHVLVGPLVWIEGIPLNTDEGQSFARADGFNDLRDFLAFWSGRLPFVGDVIHWKPAVSR